jgi:hypothetical protein
MYLISVSYFLSEDQHVLNANPLVYRIDDIPFGLFFIRYTLEFFFVLFIRNTL